MPLASRNPLHRLLVRTIWVEERKARTSHQALKAAVRVDSFAARPLADCFPLSAETQPPQDA
jgi:hypothetical protein